ncbi:uncharacterized protein LOC109793859 [Cajanus cajan]|nr:uncharacterized protein LOC109793859 [Cajanus cajan]
MFPDAFLTHLNPLKSDHAPLLLKFLSSSHTRRGSKPFRFEAAWLTHESFPAFLHQEWNTHHDWNNRIDHTVKTLLEWNRNTFGNIFFNKRRLLRRLNGIPRNLLQGPNTFLERLQVKLWSELDQILSQEEILWYQKSRCKWLKFGDRNTSYFHGTTIVRRRKSKINKLMDDNNNWITQTDDLENMVTSFYKALFSKARDSAAFTLSNAFPQLENEELLEIGSPICDAEILQAVKQMKVLKLLGLTAFKRSFLGQKVSLDKTRVFFSKNVSFSVRESISAALGFQQTGNLGKYLGILAHHSRVNRSSYQDIIKKMIQRLSGWKARNLSFAGRLTLTKSVLAALPSFTM